MDEFAVLRRMAVYQFGRGADDALFPDGEEFHVERSASGRPRQVVSDDGRLVSVGMDGRFTLGLAGGRRLYDAIDGYRVTVGDESEPFVRDGRNVFAKFVADADDAIRPEDEVVVEHERGEVIAVGRAELDAQGMLDFDSGMAVKVREGASDGD
ncbi:PUA domain-containing protein [Salarchaeum japonicum]|uniref:PUA domain-containing protein n=1 Tax=Salarchaeum japonicum TaxID=555573 RepID=A0AAV3T2T3_9EURY|nr:PUA domain-containing protein [Salarchaeum japonicum]